MHRQRSWSPTRINVKIVCLVLVLLNFQLDVCLIHAEEDPFDRTNGAWVRTGDRFRAINVYKPDEHGMFPAIVNGYGYTVPGRLFSKDGKYCMSTRNPNTVSSETWRYQTWIMYNAPDGRTGHWQDCRSHVGETVRDPIVGVFDIPVFGKTDILTNYGGCAAFHRHWALYGDFYIWEWKCDSVSDPCKPKKKVDPKKNSGPPECRAP